MKKDQLVEMSLENDGGTLAVSVMFDEMSEVSADLRRWAGGMAAGFYALEDQIFATQGSVIGSPWTKLSERYAVWKARNFPGRPLMVRSRRLKLSLTRPPTMAGTVGRMLRKFGLNAISGDAVLAVTQTTMLIGTKLPYASKQHFGDEQVKLPARRLIGTASHFAPWIVWGAQKALTDEYQQVARA